MGKAATAKAAGKTAKAHASSKSTAAVGEQDQTRKDQSNMLTQLKSSSANKEQKDLLSLYQSLPRFSDRKKELLLKWKGDKSCAWVSEYTETHERIQVNTDKKVKGHGTVSCSQ